MSDDDFDLERLAAYLHLDPAQVARLADRGKLPGRKVQGDWRFARAEIHQWLESRIGLSDDDELVQMESILRPPADSGARRRAFDRVADADRSDRRAARCPDARFGDSRR